MKIISSLLLIAGYHVILKKLLQLKKLNEFYAEK